MKVLLIGFSLFNLLFLSASTHIDDRYDAPVQYCNEINPQNDVDIDQIQGIWYGKEIITHQHYKNYDSGEYEHKSCVILNISSLQNQYIPAYLETRYQSSSRYDPSALDYYNQRPGSNQYLKLEWTEEGRTLITYVLQYKDAKRGFWKEANSTSTSTYNLATGNVQVMKAVSDHMVLTFCRPNEESNLFSIILTRPEHHINLSTIMSIREMLKRRNLPVLSIRRVCNSASFQFGSITALLFGVIIFMCKLNNLI